MKDASMKNGLAASTLIIFCLVHAGSKAVGYELKGLSWKDPKPVFTICAKDAPQGAVSRIKEAATKWKYSKFQFNFAAERCLDDPTWRKNDGVNYIAFGKLDPKASESDIAESFARNEFASDSDRMVECDIQFSTTRKWYANAIGEPGTEETDLLSVAMHEFGHCLGLEHSTTKEAVMGDMLKTGKSRRLLNIDDEKGRNAIYGAP
jgi:Matrixin